MTMNLGGYEAQLYDQNGNPAFTPEELAVEDAETKQVRNLVMQVRNYVNKIKNARAKLACEDGADIYSPNPQSGFDRPYYAVEIKGGLNGRGIWSNYLKALSDFLLKLEAAYEDVWVINIVIDPPDDVFIAKIGIYPFEGQLDQ